MIIHLWLSSWTSTNTSDFKCLLLLIKQILLLEHGQTAFMTICWSRKEAKSCSTPIIWEHILRRLCKLFSLWTKSLQNQPSKEKDERLSMNGKRLDCSLLTLLLTFNNMFSVYIKVCRGTRNSQQFQRFIVLETTVPSFIFLKFMIMSFVYI